MKFNNNTKICSFFAMSMIGALALTGILSCGSGSGSSDDGRAAVQPAPQTVNGLVLSIYPGGPTFRFVRSVGDALSDVEIGAILMDPNPVRGVSASNTVVFPSSFISGGRYQYRRNTPESGTLIITGDSSNIYDDGENTRPATYLRSPFNRTYNIIFGTDGTSVTGLNINDIGENNPAPGITWTNSNIRTQSGQPVPIGYSLLTSESFASKLYPDKALSGQFFDVTPFNTLENSLKHQFLTSTFTRFSSTAGDFSDEGVGRRSITFIATEFELINYTYRPNPQTSNQAEIRIINESGTIFTYSLRFLDFRRGTYVRENGSTGVFDFPFLEG